MIRAIFTAAAVAAAAYILSVNFIGYQKAGKEFSDALAQKRRSIKTASDKDGSRESNIRDALRKENNSLYLK